MRSGQAGPCRRSLGGRSGGDKQMQAALAWDRRRSVFILTHGERESRGRRRAEQTKETGTGRPLARTKLKGMRELESTKEIYLQRASCSYTRSGERTLPCCTLQATT